MSRNALRTPSRGISSHATVLPHGLINEYLYCAHRWQHAMHRSSVSKNFANSVTAWDFSPILFRYLTSLGCSNESQKLVPTTFMLLSISIIEIPLAICSCSCRQSPLTLPSIAPTLIEESHLPRSLVAPTFIVNHSCLDHQLSLSHSSTTYSQTIVISQSALTPLLSAP